jgi:hypothetical protein
MNKLITFIIASFVLAALPPGKGHFYRILKRSPIALYCAQALCRFRRRLFLVLKRVFRLCFPGVQQTARNCGG